MKEIFVTKERKEILQKFSIRFCVDQDLNFAFLFFNSGFGISTKTIFIFSDILIIINELRIKEQKQRKKNKKRLEKKLWN